MNAMIGALLAATLVAPTQETAWKPYHAAQVQMGVEVKIVLYAPNPEAANRATNAAYARIAQLNQIMSDFDPTSELSRLSHTAATPDFVPISCDLFRVLAAADQLSRQSEGAFDITIGSLTKQWRRARRRKELPSPHKLGEGLKATGHQNVLLDKKRPAVKLLKPGMKLDLGGIAKGFAADEALLVLSKLGYKRALVNASGDMAIGDPPPGEKGWKVAVAALKPDGKPTHKLLLSNCGIANSGDAWQHVVIAGKRYSHILNPTTGLGLTRSSSVTVIAKDCMTADSFASAISVLGPGKGIQLANQTPGLRALVVEAGEPEPRVTQTKQWP